MKLLYGLTKLKSISIKPYFINNISINKNQPIPESFVLILIEAFIIKKA